MPNLQNVGNGVVNAREKERGNQSFLYICTFFVHFLNINSLLIFKLLLSVSSSSTRNKSKSSYFATNQEYILCYSVLLQKRCVCLLAK